MVTFSEDSHRFASFCTPNVRSSVLVSLHICVRIIFQHSFPVLYLRNPIEIDLTCTYTFTPFRGLFRVKIKTCCTKTTSGLTLHRPILVPLVGYDTATITCLLIVTELAHSKRRNDTCNETHRSNVQSHTQQTETFRLKAIPKRSYAERLLSFILFDLQFLSLG